MRTADINDDPASTSNTMKSFLLLVLTGLSLSVFAQQGGYPDAGPNLALRIRVGGAIVLGEADLEKMSFADDASARAAFKNNIINIQPGTSIQLKVEMIDATGRMTDVTSNASTQYQTISPWRLTVSKKGLVTIPASHEAPPTLARPGSLGNAAIWVFFNSPPQSGWNKVFFNPPAPRER